MSDEIWCWPCWMPKPLQDGYNYEPTDRRSRTDMEVGGVIRVNYDTDETTVSCSLVCNVTQSQWFEVFERSILRQGSSWFQMPIQAGNCVTWHKARFASRPKVAVKAPRYTIYELKLDLWKRELLMCDEVAELLICLTPEELQLAFERVRKFWMSLQKLQKPWFLLDEYKDLDMSLVTNGMGGRYGM